MALLCSQGSVSMHVIITYKFVICKVVCKIAMPHISQSVVMVTKLKGKIKWVQGESSRYLKLKTEKLKKQIYLCR